jgi:hypothetical protein
VGVGDAVRQEQDELLRQVQSITGVESVRSEQEPDRAWH